MAEAVQGAKGTILGKMGDRHVNADHAETLVLERNRGELRSQRDLACKQDIKSKYKALGGIG